MLILSDEYSVITQRLASIPTIMYHGTPCKNMPSILSQGLIPNPKKRVWQDDSESGFSYPSRDSLTGTYLTTSLSTATSAGLTRGNYGKCVVVVQVQSGSMLADEDDLTFILQRGLPDHEYTVMILYMRDQMLRQNLAPSDYEREESETLVNAAKMKFVKNFMEGVRRDLKGGLTPQEEQVLLPVAAQGFHVALARKAAYVGFLFDQYSRDTYGIKAPEKSQVEQDFKRLEDRLTRILKRLGRPEHLEDKISPKGRIETPIGYSGKNKIVAVIHILPSLSIGEGGYHGEPVIVKYPPSGEVPAKLIEDWGQVRGDWDESIALGRKVNV